MKKKINFSIACIVTLVFIIPSCFLFDSGERGNSKLPETISYNFHIRPILSDKCFVCHGPDANKREAGLRLDIAEEAYKALKDNPAAHPLVPGKPQLSEAYLKISSTDTSEMMPPPSSNLKLDPFEIELIKKWILQGAKYEKHWAFIAPKKIPMPEVDNKQWVLNEIDYFVLQKMEQNSLSPNKEENKERLLRRLCLDITGLPPNEKMMKIFLADSSKDVYEKIVNELFLSPAYGEKMALHWLDISRYADSHGYQDDYYRTQWPWRDWVIHAFNNNMRYDQFVSWQLAGDLMPNATKEQILATAFNRNHKITEEGGVIDEEYRVEYVTDRANTFSKGLLSMTMECAHCHDHKYDPISQKEHYQLFAFFNNIKEAGLEDGYQAAKKPFIQISNDDVKNLIRFVNKKDTGKLIVSVMGERDTLRKTYLLTRGAYDAHGEEVFPGMPKAILPFDDNLPKSRLGLAKWLFDKRNPLTARVYVNQIWQEFFGRGIVKTAGDFGMQGELPSHPELLDWLAVDFMNNGWNIQRLIRQIVTSATYRQSAVIEKKKYAADPENVYLSRFPRLRLRPEFIRDLILSSSGLLVKEIGGPSVKTYQPKGIWEAAASTGGIAGNLGTYKQDHGASLYRRGIYSFIKRTVPPPSMMIFDASTRDQCEVKRMKTNTPLQALVMMNDPTVLEASRVFATRLLEENCSVNDKISKAFRLILSRKPKVEELKILSIYFEQNLQSLKIENVNKLLAIGEYPLAAKTDQKMMAALMLTISNMYNLEEAITK